MNYLSQRVSREEIVLIFEFLFQLSLRSNEHLFEQQFPMRRNRGNLGGCGM